MSKLLLDNMAGHEEHLQESLAQFKKEASYKILDTRFKYVPSSAILKDCKDVQLKPDISVVEIIRVAIKFDNCREEFYTIMAENCVSNKVKSVFSNHVKRKIMKIRNLSETPQGN